MEPSGAPRSEARSSVVHVINSLGIGGAEKQLAELAPALQRLGFHQQIVPLVAAREGGRIPGIPVVRQPSSRPLAIINALRETVRSCKRKPGSTLVCWMYHSWLVGLVAKIASPSTRLFFYCRHGSVASLRATTRLLARVLLRLSAAMNIPVVFNSEASRRSHQALVSLPRTWVIPNAVRIEAQERIDGRVIGFMGRNHPDKGADLLGGIIARLGAALPTWRFVVAGPGMDDLESHIRGDMAEMGVPQDRLVVQGTVADVPRFLSQIAILLLPSRAESFPNVVAEAMACGTIPVCMSVGAVDEILGGILPSAPDTEALIGIAVDVCTWTEARRDALAARLREQVLHYDIDVVAQQHATLWGIS